MGSNDDLYWMILAAQTFLIGLHSCMLAASYGKHGLCFAPFGSGVGFLSMVLTSDFVHAYDAWYIWMNLMVSPRFLLLSQILMYAFERVQPILCGKQYPPEHLFSFCRLVSMFGLITIPFLNDLGLNVIAYASTMETTTAYFSEFRVILSLYSALISIYEIWRIIRSGITHPTHITSKTLL